MLDLLLQGFQFIFEFFSLVEARRKDEKNYQTTDCEYLDADFLHHHNIAFDAKFIVGSDFKERIQGRFGVNGINAFVCLWNNEALRKYFRPVLHKVAEMHNFRVDGFVLMGDVRDLDLNE